MQKIASFTIDHIKLQPGIYVSRKDYLGAEVITTFDLRMTSPNEEPVMNTAEVVNELRFRSQLISFFMCVMKLLLFHLYRDNIDNPAPEDSLLTGKTACSPLSALYSVADPANLSYSL